MRLHRFRLMRLFGAVTLVVAACASDDSSGATSTTGSLGPTTSALPATTTTETSPPATTTTLPATTTSTGAAMTTVTPTDTNSLASGSGCTPGIPDSLPDGEWFGYVDDASPRTVVFDLACWFVGDAAVLAAAEDGEESPPPNDYHVRNVNPGLRTLVWRDGASVTWLPDTGDPSTEETVPYLDWVARRSGREAQPGIWLTIEDRAVVDAREQFVP